MGNIHMSSQNQHHIQAVYNDKEYTNPLKCAIEKKFDEPNHVVAHESTNPMKNPQPPIKPNNVRKLLQMADGIEKDMANALPTSFGDSK
jgi:hypothetical protein